MWSILYTCDDVIHHIGPFDTEDQALTACRKAHKNGEFDINDQHVYLMWPDHKLVELSIHDFDLD